MWWCGIFLRRGVVVTLKPLHHPWSRSAHGLVRPSADSQQLQIVPPSIDEEMK